MHVFLSSCSIDISAWGNFTAKYTYVSPPSQLIRVITFESDLHDFL